MNNLDLFGRCLAGARRNREVSDIRLCAEMGCNRNTLSRKSKHPEEMSVEQLFAVAPLIGLEIIIRPKGQK